LKYLKYPSIVIALLLVLFITMQIRSCYHERNTERYSVLEGQYTAHKEEAAKKKEILEAEIQERDSRILEFQKEIITVREERDSLAAENKVQDNKLEELEVKFSLITDKDEKIENLQLQIGVWKNKFNLALQEIETWKAESKRWQLSYEEQVQITESYKQQLRDQEALTELCEKRILTVEKSNKRLKIETRIAETVIAGFCLKTGYDLLKGK